MDPIGFLGSLGDIPQHVAPCQTADLIGFHLIAKSSFKIDLAAWERWERWGGSSFMSSIYMGVSKNRGTPKWMVYRENPIKMDDLGYPYFWKHPHGLIGWISHEWTSDSTIRTELVQILFINCTQNVDAIIWYQCRMNISPVLLVFMTLDHPYCGKITPLLALAIMNLIPCCTLQLCLVSWQPSIQNIMDVYTHNMKVVCHNPKKTIHMYLFSHMHIVACLGLFIYGAWELFQNSSKLFLVSLNTLPHHKSNIP